METPHLDEVRKNLRTVCALCTGEDMASAEAHEEHWRERPYNAGERKCKGCGIYRHWWYFLATWQDRK